MEERQTDRQNNYREGLGKARPFSFLLIISETGNFIRNANYVGAYLSSWMAVGNVY